MVNRPVLVGVVVLYGVLGASGIYDAKGDVKLLDNLDDVHEITLVEFYAPVSLPRGS